MAIAEQDFHIKSLKIDFDLEMPLQVIPFNTIPTGISRNLTKSTGI